jgi:hypothetical protein
MQTVKPIIVMTLAGALAACGSGGQSPASSEGAHRAAEASLPANASALQVATHMRGDVHCPAKIQTPPQAAGVPVDDVRGVRPGETYEEAANVVMCTDPMLVVKPDDDHGFQINTYGLKIRQGFSARFAEAEKTSQQIMREMEEEQQARMSNAIRQDLKPGEEKWFVSTMGMPGQERVIAVARDNWYAKGKNPTVASVIQALVKKYGQPTEKSPEEHVSLQRVNYSVRWAFDPRGRLITETSPLFHQCYGFSDPDNGFHLSADCGTVVQAAVISTSENADLAQSLQVGVVNQTAGYALLTATQQGLQAADAAQRAAQVKQAAKNADATQL